MKGCQVAVTWVRIQVSAAYDKENSNENGFHFGQGKLTNKQR